MPTLGGAIVEVAGRNLGLLATVVTLTYSGGSDGMTPRNRTAGACVIATPGTLLRCPSVAGVGANYTFVVTVEGGVSDPGQDRLSYTPPSISSVEGAGAVQASTAGGALVLLRGVRGDSRLCGCL